MSIIKKIKSTGLRYSFAILFNRVVPAWLFRCRRFTIYQMDSRSAEDIKPNPKIELKWCDSQEEIQAVERLTYFRREASSGTSFACHAKLESNLVGAFWAATEKFDETELGVQIVLEPHQVWLFAALVDKTFRGQRIYSNILKFILPGLDDKELPHQLVCVNPHNLASNHVHKKHSKHSPGSVLVIRFLKLAVCFASGETKTDRLFAFNSAKNPIKIHIKST